SHLALFFVVRHPPPAGIYTLSPTRRSSDLVRRRRRRPARHAPRAARRRLSGAGERGAAAAFPCRSGRRRAVARRVAHRQGSGTRGGGDAATPLDALLDTEGRARLGELTGQVTAHPARIAVPSRAMSRAVGRGPADPDDPDGMVTPRIEDQARVALVCAAAQGWDRDALVAEIGALYRHGDADEKRAVLRALDHLDVGDAALDLVGDALRGN